MVAMQNGTRQRDQRFASFTEPFHFPAPPCDRFFGVSSAFLNTQQGGIAQFFLFPILLRTFSHLLGRSFDIEQIIGYLKGKSQGFAERFQRVEILSRRMGRVGSEFEGGP